MALSGSVSTNAGMDGRYYKLSWTATQSIPDNISTISWTLSAEGATTEWIMERRLYTTINGVTVYNYSSDDGRERWAGTIDSGTILIPHNDDGSKSFLITLGAAVYYANVNCTGTSMFTLDTIARKSSLTVEGGSLGSTISITADSKSDSFKHKLTYSCGEYEGIIDNNSYETSWTFVPKLEWATSELYGTLVLAVFTLTTYSGDGTQIGSDSRAVWFTIPDSIKPSCFLSLSEPPGQTHLNTYGGYIQGQSRLHVVVNSTTAYGSPITACQTTVNGSTYSTTSFDTSPLRYSGTNRVSTTVTDGRGRSDSASSDITVIPYSNPAVTKLSVKRCDSNGIENANGSFAKITYSYSITSLSEHNGKAAKLVYKKASDDTWTTETLEAAYSITNATYIFPADDDSSYSVQLLVSDSFTSTSASTTVSTGYSLFHIPVSGKGITFGGIAEKDGFNVIMPAHFAGGITEDIQISAGDCNAMLESGTYYMGNEATNKPAINGSATNGWLTVKALSDASDIPAYVYQEYASSTGTRWFRMRENGTWGSWDYRHDEFCNKYAGYSPNDLPPFSGTFHVNSSEGVPSGSGWYIIKQHLFNASTHYRLQIAYKLGLGNTHSWIRQYVQGTWGSWGQN